MTTKPKRDMVATDGQTLTLGDTTITLYLTPVVYTYMASMVKTRKIPVTATAKPATA